MKSLNLMLAAFFVLQAGAGIADIRDEIEAILSADTKDLAHTKFELDLLVDPTIDVDASIIEIDRMAERLRAMLPEGADG